VSANTERCAEGTPEAHAQTQSTWKISASGVIAASGSGEVVALQVADERGPNVIVPAGVVDLAYLSDPPSRGVRILEAAGVEVHAA
jgi:hypothetical protein